MNQPQFYLPNVGVNVSRLNSHCAVFTSVFIIDFGDGRECKCPSIKVKY